MNKHRLTSTFRLIALLLLLSGSKTYAAANAPAWDSLRMKTMPEWQSYFNEYGVSGTLVIYDQQKARYYVYDSVRFEQRFSPASTFKIFNSLVALETKAVKNEKQTLKWDGFERELPAWNSSQDMRYAYKNSTVWFYQELARRIGFTQMQSWIDKCSYGNKDISGGIDNFWLTGKLRISAREQVEFLKRLQNNLLPFSPKVVETVRNLMIEEKNSNFTLRSKTGWSVRKGEADLGWYVGYIEKEKPGKEKKKDYYFFALNIDMSDASKAEARKLIVRRILTTMKII